MKFTLLDREHWPRREHFEHYHQQVPCTYSLCTQWDITQLYRQVKARGWNLYPVLIYGLAQAVNAHSEFRMDLDEQGQLGYWEVSHPSYTVFHPDDETFSTLWTEYTPDLALFYQRVQEDLKEYGSLHGMAPKPTCAGTTFDVSSIPWTSFQGFNLNLQGSFDYFSPIFTMGRWTETEGRLLLPLAVQVNHAVCDGFHTARLIGDLQTWAKQRILED